MTRYLSVIYIILIILSGILTCGCDRQPHSDVEAVVDRWIGKTIKFPGDSIGAFVVGRDTVASPVFDARFTVVRYVDSVGCTSCKLRLPEYRSLIERFNMLSSNRVDYLLVVTPCDIREFREILKRDNVKYPVLLDEDASFKKLNELEDSDVFHMMLLDKDRKVLAIGNPAISPKVMKLYVDLLTENAVSGGNYIKITTINSEVRNHDFGDVCVGTVAHHRFHITNTGNEYFFADTVVSSCDCTRAMIHPRNIAPGEIAEVTVAFHADEPTGFFEREVDVVGNIPSGKFTLTLTGTVVGK